jgi:hypothetical protein
MSRRMLRVVSPFGLSLCFFFLLASTSLPAFAATTTSTSQTSIAPRTVSTSVLCQATTLSFGWTQTGNGPAGFGCGGSAWQVATPTSADASYYMGSITSSGTYSLRAFITDHATAPMDYVIEATKRGGLITIKDCFYNQTQGLAWETICQFTVSSSLANNGWGLTVYEHSGAVNSYILSSSAIQLLPA